MDFRIHSIIALTFYIIFLMSSLTGILRYFKHEINIWKNTVDVKIDDIYQNIASYNTSTATVVEIVNKFNNTVDILQEANSKLESQLSEIKSALDNINCKVNILEDELSNNVRCKLYKLVILNTRGFDVSLEAEKVFMSYLLDKNINDIADAAGRLSKNIELLNDINFKISILGNTKNYLTSCFVGYDINNNPCGYPQKLIQEIVEIQLNCFDSFVNNLKLALSLSRDVNIKEIILIHVYREFEEYVEKAYISFEKNSKDIKDVTYLKARYPNSKYLKNGNKSIAHNVEDLNKNTLLTFLSKGNNGIKEVLNVLKNTSDLNEGILNTIIVLSGQFNQILADQSLGLENGNEEINRINLALTEIIQENF